MKAVRSGENVVSTLREVPGWRGKWILCGEQAFRKALLSNSPDFVAGSFVFRPLQNLAPLYIDLDLEFLGEPDDNSKKLMYMMSIITKAWFQVTGNDEKVDVYCFQRPEAYR